MNPYKIHGMLQLIAFAVLFPMGALIAMFRYKIGPGWLRWHIILQLLASSFVIAAVVILAVHNLKNKHSKVATNKKKKENVEKHAHNKYETWHKLVGAAVFILIIVQLVWAFFGKRLVEWNIWLFIHASVAVLILLGGWTNMYLAWKMH